MVPRGGGGRALLLAAGAVLLAVACAAGPDDGEAGSTTSTVTATIDGSTVPGGDGTTVDGTSPGTAGDASGTTTPTAPMAPDPSVPIVDPASVEAFCALDAQLDQLSAAQMADADPTDPEAFRVAFARFVTDNDAVIDQYVAAAPPEIEPEVDATIGQALDAVDDPNRFREAMASSDASRRVSAFIDANCR